MITKWNSDPNNYINDVTMIIEIISASSGDLGANDWLKIFQKYIFNFVKIQKKYKFDWILSKFSISNFRNFCRRNFKQTFL